MNLGRWPNVQFFLVFFSVHGTSLQLAGSHRSSLMNRAVVLDVPGAPALSEWVRFGCE